MKKSNKEILDNYIPKIPSKFWYFVYRFLLFFLTFGRRVKYTYHFDKNKMKNKPVLLLSDHSSTDSYQYASFGYPFVNPNIIIGYQNLLLKGFFKLFLKIGVIPKYLYTPDFKTTKSIVRLIRQNASFLLFPEGIQSTAGSMMPLNSSTAKLIKMCEYDVVLCKTLGSYLNRPRFDSNYRHGPIEVSYEIIFTAEEVKTLSEEEIYNRLLDKFYYNEFKWNQEKHYEYKGKHPNSYNIDRILYYCPKCQKTHTLYVDKDSIKCECGLDVKIDSEYNMITNIDNFPFKRIDEWVNYQRKLIREQIEDDNFSYSYDCSYQQLDFEHLSTDSVKTIGIGVITIDKTGVKYNGMINGENKELFFPIESLISAPFVSGLANEFYYNNEYYRFTPISEKSISLEVMMIIEELHNLKDELHTKLLQDTLKD